jgi:hypothetical protein
MLYCCLPIKYIDTITKKILEYLFLHAAILRLAQDPVQGPPQGPHLK